MTNTVEYTYFEDDFLDRESEIKDYGNWNKALIAMIILTITVVIGTAVFINTNPVKAEQFITEETVNYFGDEVSEDERLVNSEIIMGYFNSIDVSDEVKEIRQHSHSVYDEADTKARILEGVAKVTELESIDKITGIEDEYRVYITINTVDGEELIIGNQYYLTQAFCGGTNKEINKIFIEIVKKFAKANTSVQTYVTVKNGQVDDTELIKSLNHVYEVVKSVGL